MTPQLSSLWASVAPAMANHLWQSTLAAAIAGLLTLPLRKNQARVRYWLWLAASIKFLLPFSLLIAFGSHLTTPRPPTGMQTGYYYATQVSQPFDQLSTPAIVPAVSATQHLSLAHLLPVIVLFAWLCGLIAVLGLWFARWRRIRALVRQAAPVEVGREVETLRRLERANKIHRPISLRLSAESLEPGIFGIFRPVLLWPEGISAHLNDAHLEAILAHELRHVRYRDNSAAAIHAVVQAIFWFYPLVWWLGARMVAERERGCDEEVVGMGSQPGVYAEGILKACEFCVASPLATFSGVTGADLKKRVVRIMTGGAGNPLTPAKRRLLTVAGVAALAGPLLIGLVNVPHVRVQLLQANGPLPSFEVVSVKPSRSGDHEPSIRILPGRFTTENFSLKGVIQFAYDVHSDDQLAGAPNWAGSQNYDIDAKETDSQVGELSKLPPRQREDEVKFMIQSLLADRFRLKVSYRTKELPVYALMIAKNGSKLMPASAPPPSLPGAKPSNPPNDFGSGVWTREGNQVIGKERGAQIRVLADVLSQQPELGGRVVLDETGLKGKYDWTVQWTREFPALNDAGGQQPAAVSTPPPDTSGPSLFTALQEQLGLKLEATKGPVEVLVIDHVEKPSEN